MARVALQVYRAGREHRGDPLTAIGIRGAFFDFVDDPWKHIGRERDAARFHGDGLLVVEKGRIVDFGAWKTIAKRHRALEVTRIRERLLLPGFIDGHIHFPQTRVLGSFGEQLLPWLQKWVFPEELKYRNRAYARKGATEFFDNLLAAGTTTCQAFTTSSPVSAESLFDEASRRNMRLIAGLTGIDKLAPAQFLNTPDDFYKQSKRLIGRYHRKGRNLYAITPRFALGASRELMEACRRLKHEHPDCWVNTHIAENPSEVAAMRAAYADCADYLAAYEKYDLVGPKFTGGHGIYLSDGEFDRLARSGAAVAFCPCSNLFLGSGLFRLGRATDPGSRVRLAWGSDVGGGNRFSMLGVLEDAYKVGMCNSTLLEDKAEAEAERNKVSPYRGFWSVTLGGAEALYIDDAVGNFDVGKEADLVALDWTAGPRAQAWHQSLIAGGKAPRTVDQAANLLFGVMMVGDDRCVDETWVMGKRLYKKKP